MCVGSKIEEEVESDSRWVRDEQMEMNKVKIITEGEPNTEHDFYGC